MDALEEQQKKVVVKYKPTYRLEPLEERKYVDISIFLSVSIFILFVVCVGTNIKEKNVHLQHILTFKMMHDLNFLI